MARNGSGSYSAPSNSFNPAAVDTTIDQDDWNTLLADIETAISGSIASDGQTTTTQRIPFAAGISTDTVAEKTGNAGVTVDGVLLKDGRVDTAKGADIASATSTDIGAAMGNYLDITGTTQIDGFGTITAGRTRIVQFDGILQLTHSSALILPGGANITTATGDVAGFVSEGSGNWRCLFYSKASGAAIVGLLNVVEDTTPQLGGNLDANGNVINMGDNEIVRPVIKDYGETINALGSIGGGTQDIDLTLGNVVSGTVDTSTTTFTFSNPPATGTAGSFTLILTNGGSQTVNWPASVDWAGGTAPTLTTAGVDVLTFTTLDAGTTWYGFAAGLDMS